MTFSHDDRSQRYLDTSPPHPFAWGTRTFVMGIINVTPDSFSGDGIGSNVDAAVDQGLSFEALGADILDVGGQSTRPGHTSVSEHDELLRVLPVIKALAPRTTLPISIDTFYARVAAESLSAGASIINDQWALRRDPEMASLAADATVPVVLMHNQQGTDYRDLIPDIRYSLASSVEMAVEAGVRPENIIIDPGLGFGKTLEHNLEVVRRLSELKGIAPAILVGPSRKSMIGRTLDLPVDQRVEGTAAVVALCIANGADIARVHDVQAMIRVCRMADAIVRPALNGREGS